MQKYYYNDRINGAFICASGMAMLMYERAIHK